MTKKPSQGITNYHKASQGITGYHKVLMGITKYHKASQDITEKASQSTTKYLRYHTVSHSITSKKDHKKWLANADKRFWSMVKIKRRRYSHACMLAMCEDRSALMNQKVKKLNSPWTKFVITKLVKQLLLLFHHSKCVIRNKRDTNGVCDNCDTVTPHKLCNAILHSPNRAASVISRNLLRRKTDFPFIWRQLGEQAAKNCSCKEKMNNSISFWIYSNSLWTYGRTAKSCKKLFVQRKNEFFNFVLNTVEFRK